mmetsp:Transcript_23019/g.33648  ORF Transcript_23019/g.33648 Transcript_23019/m.33648 type:complete len:348 (+) Transcript_23019:60-1103(+)
MDYHRSSSLSSIDAPSDEDDESLLLTPHRHVNSNNTVSSSSSSSASSPSLVLMEDNSTTVVQCLDSGTNCTGSSVATSVSSMSPNSTSSSNLKNGIRSDVGFDAKVGKKGESGSVCLSGDADSYGLFLPPSDSSFGDKEGSNVENEPSSVPIISRLSRRSSFAVGHRTEHSVEDGAWDSGGGVLDTDQQRQHRRRVGIRNRKGSMWKYLVYLMILSVMTLSELGFFTSTYESAKEARSSISSSSLPPSNQQPNHSHPPQPKIQNKDSRSGIRRSTKPRIQTPSYARTKRTGTTPIYYPSNSEHSPSTTNNTNQAFVYLTTIIFLTSIVLVTGSSEARRRWIELQQSE